MSITKKGSRRIMVGGITYRWMVRPKPTYDQGLTWGALSFAVELEVSGQSILIVTIDAPRPDNWVGEQGFVITPSLVAQAIEQALAQGWKPESKGSPHELALSVSPTNLISSNTHTGDATSTT
ncbi:MAG: hypothetical protein FWF41_10000 [Betaproteobacteria bacterium]|nr:hypothetical protein [Betaproteobacteria bacterium]